MSEQDSKQRRDRRNVILEKTSELFAKNGFSGTSIRSIASSANVAISLIYYYFESKDNLWHESLLQCFQRYEMMKKMHSIHNSNLSIEKVREMAVGSGSYFDILMRKLEYMQMIAWIYAEQNMHVECPDQMKDKAVFALMELENCRNQVSVRAGNAPAAGRISLFQSDKKGSRKRRCCEWIRMISRTDAPSITTTIH